MVGVWIGGFWVLVGGVGCFGLIRKGIWVWVSVWLGVAEWREVMVEVGFRRRRSAVVVCVWGFDNGEREREGVDQREGGRVVCNMIG